MTKPPPATPAIPALESRSPTLLNLNPWHEVTETDDQALMAKDNIAHTRVATLLERQKSWIGGYKEVRAKEEVCTVGINALKTDVLQKKSSNGLNKSLQNIVEFRELVEQENALPSLDLDTSLIQRCRLADTKVVDSPSPYGFSDPKKINPTKTNRFVCRHYDNEETAWDNLPTPRTLPPVNDKWIFRYSKNRRTEETQYDESKLSRSKVKSWRLKNVFYVPANVSPDLTSTFPKLDPSIPKLTNISTQYLRSYMKRQASIPVIQRSEPDFEKLSQTMKQARPTSRKIFRFSLPKSGNA